MFKNLFLSFLFLSFILKASLFANEGFFLGFEGALSSSILKDRNKKLPVPDIYDGVAEVSYKSSNVYGLGKDLAIKVGYILAKYHRFYTSLSYGSRIDKEILTGYTFFPSAYIGNSYKINAKSLDLFLGYDFAPSISKEFKTLLGLYLGYSNLNLKIDDKAYAYPAFTQGVNKNFLGLAYGVKAGFIFDINEKNEIDLSLRYTQRTYSKKDIQDMSIKPSTSDVALYLGYTYKF